MPKPFVDIEQRIINEIIWYPGDRVEIKGSKGRIIAVHEATVTIKYDKPKEYLRMDDSVGYDTHIICSKNKPCRITEDYSD